MWRVVSVNAYDMLDRVQITVRLRTYDGTEASAAAASLDLSWDEQSVGAGDDLAWLRHVTGSLYDFLRRYEDVPR